MKKPPSIQNENKTINVYCGELCRSDICDSREINITYQNQHEIMSNVSIGLDKFIKDPESLPLNVLDLLQIAAYIYCADRLSHRGDRDSLSNRSWARSFKIHIPVLDYSFWSVNTIKKMSEALTFMTGDRKYEFEFTEATINPLEKEDIQSTLFSEKYISLDEAESSDIMLFSGGLDSLAGAIEHLNLNPDRKICLVSHKSNNGTTRTQNTLAKALIEKYGDRITQYGFECHNRKGNPSKDESQRTRMFLFSSIAFAICHCYNKEEFFVYENGITSINLSKQMDVINARGSRTTHPKTIGLLKSFFHCFSPDFQIRTPYYAKTKAEVLDVFKTYNEERLISSSVSCSSTRNKPKSMSQHCGCCSQCIDRIFATYAVELNEVDNIYADNIVTKIPNQETKQRVINTLYLACAEISLGRDIFFSNHPDELMDVIEYWPGNNPDDKLEDIYSLFCNFGDSMISALKRIRFLYDDPAKHYSEDSLLHIISNKKYLNPPISLKVEEIDSFLKTSLPMMFKSSKPKNENDFNDKVAGLLRSHDSFTREYPVLCFGETEYRADHGHEGLIIESKYIRDGTTPSKASEGIAADIVKIPTDVEGIMFIVYDPYRSITDDKSFSDAFCNTRENCFVFIYR